MRPVSRRFGGPWQMSSRTVVLRPFFSAYLPTGPAPGRRGDKSINLSSRLTVAVSPTGGRLFGFGVRTSEQRKLNLPGDQFFRIDYFDRNETPPLNVHYHVFGEKDHHPGPDRVIWTP